MTINDLYQKISDFEQKLKPSTKDKLVCNEGCSRCCYTDISIFQIEADNIREWFSHLSASSKESLRQKWREAPSVMENFFNQTVPACVFLKGESCTIYDVRPLICRTQGLPLMYKMEDQSFVDLSSE
jgi:Fe-S-cluster containining protein